MTETPLESKSESYFEQCFQMEETIGTGYFGKVVRARDRKDGKLYAIKIAIEQYKGSSDRERKLEEVRPALIVYLIA